MWLTLFACQEPFAVDRHDLAGFRIAAISVSPISGGSIAAPTLALVVDGRPWSESFVDIGWFWVEDPKDVLDIEPIRSPDATGPLPELVVPADKRILAVIARLDDMERRAFIELPEGFTSDTAPSSIVPTSIAIDSLPLTLDTVEGTDLLLSARDTLDSSDFTMTSPGDFLRFTANVQNDPLIRWMATAGTFFELDRHTTDWVSADLVLDEDEIEEGRTAIAAGWVTFLALSLGEPGQTAFRSFDIPVGIEATGLWVGGRFVPTDAPIDWQPGDAVRGTLAADDDSPFGLVLQSPIIEPASQVADYGTSALSCLVTRDGPLNPEWWLAAICGRSGAVGVEVVVVPETAP